jgi:hypothetical protein
MLQHLLETTLFHLRINLLRHEAILLDSEGTGIKPGALHDESGVVVEPDEDFSVGAVA